MGNVSPNATPANIISTGRTAVTAAPTSPAKPYDSGTIITWCLPHKIPQKLVDGTQSYSTKKGEVFTDFVSGNIVAESTTLLSLQEEGNSQSGPKQDD